MFGRAGAPASGIRVASSTLDGALRRHSRGRLRSSKDLVEVVRRPRTFSQSPFQGWCETVRRRGGSLKGSRKCSSSSRRPSRGPFENAAGFSKASNGPSKLVNPFARPSRWYLRDRKRPRDTLSEGRAKSLFRAKAPREPFFVLRDRRERPQEGQSDAPFRRMRPRRGHVNGSVRRKEPRKASSRGETRSNWPPHG